MMICYDGEKVTLKGGAPTLFSMGVSLGRQVRWNGHYHDHRFYSILCHTCAVADLCKPKDRLRGAFHDVPEVLASDVPTPMKTKWARKREHILLRNICIVYGLGWPIPAAQEKRVKKIDDLVKTAEAHILKHPSAEEFFPDPDRDVMKVVNKYLNMGNMLLEPHTSGPFFEARFARYAKAAGHKLPTLR
jgi:hypothetical protein